MLNKVRYFQKVIWVGIFQQFVVKGYLQYTREYIFLWQIGDSVEIRAQSILYRGHNYIKYWLCPESYSWIYVLSNDLTQV